MDRTKTNSINALAAEIFQANAEKGFWDHRRNVGEMLMLVTSELGEAMEAHRKGRFTNYEKVTDSFLANGTDEPSFKEAFELHVKDTFQDEIADAVIRLFDMAGGMRIDLGWHIKNKLRYNATRERLHGKKY